MSLERELTAELTGHGADVVSFVDISHLSDEHTNGYPTAILLGMVLSPAYLHTITTTSEYVQQMIRSHEVAADEFHCKETQTDSLADEMASYLTVNGYSACSQSEKHLSLTGRYHAPTKTTPLPHKTIALLAGIGWIGKHNLLVTPEFGSALSMCTVLTDAPVTTVCQAPATSRCGNCQVCQARCAPNAITGKTWNMSTSRDALLDVEKCTTCLECLAFCPWTVRYMKKNRAKRCV